MKVWIVSHALVLPENRARWQRLTSRYEDMSVTLLVPQEWQSNWFGQINMWRTEPEHSEGYHMLPIPVSHKSDWNRYLFLWTGSALRRAAPDILHICQEETTWVLQQMLLYRQVWSARTRLVFFSWNNLEVPLHTPLERLKWQRVCTGADAAIAGNTEIRNVLQRAGFHKQILIQPEIGVDDEMFYPDDSIGNDIRTQLGLQGVVFGFAGRLIAAKGVLDLAEAVCCVTGDWSLLMIGDGDCRPLIEQRLHAAGYAARLHIIGELPRRKMADYLRAMDVLVLPSRTMQTWKEQFGMVLAEAMACGVPVIGSNSGAIPEVIGDTGFVFRESDVTQLTDRLQQLLERPDLRADLSQCGLMRCREHYSAKALADEIYRFYAQLCSGSEASHAE